MNKLRIQSLYPRAVFTKRNASSYLSNLWSPQPFQIGYPIPNPNIQQEREELNKLLFSEHNLQDEDINRVDLSLAELKELGKHKIRYIHPKPTRLIGENLYKIQFPQQTSHYAKKLWNRLPQESQLKLIESPNLDILHDERLRIWKGYEIVEHLKRNRPEYQYNPYPLSGLYPWEIIKDKIRKRSLRNKRKRTIFEFEWDYYDQLIKEAFGSNVKRTAVQIYYTQLRSIFPDQKYTFTNVFKEFNQLSDSEKQIYYDTEARFHEQAIVSRDRVSTVNSRTFRTFYKQYIATTEYDQRQLLNAIRIYKQMDATQRNSYSRARQCTFHKYREETLDLQTAMVMDYVYYVGGVEGHPPGSFDWYNDMKRQTKGFTYLDKCYTEILQTR
ncbi:hypothetical protein DFJ63DRAFT_24627 [Scheffersomyces coipomensis]|uniref:uncharacterized protein n=1 Tax=Scheffersomyces coipomensis TaxID=1788519 RepID=UPI00315CA6BB